jgi:hypothetical protein
MSVVVTVGLVATLLWRRTRPLLMVAIVFAVLGPLMVLTSGAVPQMYTGAYVLVLPYALFRSPCGPTRPTGSATAPKPG